MSASDVLLSGTTDPIAAAERRQRAVFSDTEQASGRVGETRGRFGAAVLAAVAAAGLWAATASGTQPPAGGATMFVHSAGSGELRNGRLTLHGVSGKVTWAHDSGRSGVLAVRRLHRRLSAAGKPGATGTLHVAGHRGGDEPTFRLSRPRYNRARHTVSYRARPLNKKSLPGRAAHAAGAPRTFGAASLSIVAAPQATDGSPLQAQNDSYPCPRAGNTCYGTISASGLQPFEEVDVAMVLQNGGSFQLTSYVTDRNGNLAPTRLALVCGGAARFGFNISASGAQTVHADPPPGCFS
jgi:hypothetical protein